MNVKLNELERVYLIKSTDRIFRPTCDCEEYDRFYSCYNKCRIGKIYSIVRSIKSKLSDLTDLQQILEEVNKIRFDDIECGLCLDNKPFFAACPGFRDQSHNYRQCNVTVCTECAKKIKRCPLCDKEIPQYMINVYMRS